MGGAFRCNALQENCFSTSPSDRDASTSMKTEKVQTEWMLCNTRSKMGQEAVLKGVPHSSNLSLEGGAWSLTCVAALETGSGRECMCGHHRGDAKRCP